MTDSMIDKSMSNALFSLEMEGFSVDEQTQTLCKKLLQNEITLDEYISLVKQKIGVVA